MRLIVLMLLLFSALLQGCAMKSLNDWDLTWLDFTSKPSSEGADQDSLTMSEFIQQGSEGQSRVFAVTPWGEQQQVTLGKPYFSASGKQCREVTTSQEKSADQTLRRVCMR